MLPRPLTDDEIPLAVFAFNSLFRAVDEFGSPFQPEVPARALIYPTGPFGFDEQEFSALLKTIDRGDRERCFVSCVRSPTIERDDASQYVVSPLDYDSYVHPNAHYVLVAHALYPSSGAWGIVTSNESQVVAGGSESFIAKLLEGVGRTQDEMVAEWLDQWAVYQEEYANRRPVDRLGDTEVARVGDWIPAQLAHVVGPARAERALSASKLRRWD